MTSALCPSSPAKQGALLFGIVVGDRLAYLPTPLEVSADDLQTAGDDVEHRFRFSLPCRHNHCHNFAAGHCGLIGKLLAQQAAQRPASQYSSEELPLCGIREKCQWFGSVGARACAICPTVRRPQEKPLTRDG